MFAIIVALIVAVPPSFSVENKMPVFVVVNKMPPAPPSIIVSGPVRPCYIDANGRKVCPTR